MSKNQDPKQDQPSTDNRDNARASWKFGGDQVNQATAHLPSDAREALRWFFYWCIENDTARTAAAEIVKVNQSTLHRVYTGKYTDGEGRKILPAKLVDNIKSFRRIHQKRETLGDVPFVVTPTVKKIWQICDLAVESNRIAFIWGSPQTGKTFGLEEYRRLHNHGATKYIRIEPSSGIHELMRQIGAECALSIKTGYDNLKRRVARAIDRNTLLIVDEIHMLAFTYRSRSKLSCVESLRWLHDVTRCGMVICGTNIWRDEMQEGKDKKLLEQMQRRGVFRLQLPDVPPVADLKAITSKAFNLPWPSSENGRALEVLNHVNRAQGLTAVTEYLRFANRIAAKRKEPLSWDHFLRAWKIITDLEK